MDEYFYGATLDSSNKTWSCEDANTKKFPSPFYKLVVRQFLLGHKAKEDEYNVVEVETQSINDSVKVPVAVLKAGETRAVQATLEFPDAPVTLKLVSGNGPIYIHGQQIPGNYEVDYNEEEDESDNEEGESENDEDVAAKKSQKNVKNGNEKNGKVKK